IEVNPRVSRSSALASKATGYPIARVAAKIAMGYTLDEIDALAEPRLHHVAVKIPRWPFDKFVGGDRVLGTQMKATGEVMALERSVAAALMKAVRSPEIGVYGLRLPGMTDWSDEEVRRRLREADDERLFVVAEALRRGVPPREIADATAIDLFFVEVVARVIEVEQQLAALTPRGPGAAEQWSEAAWALVAEAKRLGIADREIGWLTDVPQLEIRAGRRMRGIVPEFRTVAVHAAGQDAGAPYMYSTYEAAGGGPVAAPRGLDAAAPDAGGQADSHTRPGVLVLGSGPIRIGQGIEFDYCSVHSVRALRE